jgi:radical SAM enzyme (rSAM/lipoprotein system)
MKSKILHKFQQYIHNEFRKNEIYLHELNYLFWECTQSCNLKCLHCGSDCKKDSKIPDMPFDDFLNAILPLKEKYKKDSITVVITGGEPLLRSDLAHCGTQLRNNGFRWGIVTNGYFYDNEIHCKLLGAGMGALTLSIDGLSGSHNWLRGNKDSFERAERALDLIITSKRLNYDVVTCVNSQNINQLPNLRDFLITKKVKAWRLFTIAPIGRAGENNDFRLNSKQLTYLMNFISKFRPDKQIDIKFSCEAYTGVYEKNVRDSFFFCRAGINVASVLIDGSISACPNIDRFFVQGNIYKDNFLSIWENKFEIMRNRNWTKKGECLNCPDYGNCHGGAMHLWDKKKESILICLNKNLKLEEFSH